MGQPISAGALLKSWSELQQRGDLFFGGGEDTHTPICWICSGLSLLVFELSMGVASVAFVPFSWLSKCHREMITSNHA